MAHKLPSSLSPHICVLQSPDLTELLEASNLPSLSSILQSFSPLPQVTTRTTNLISVPHASFSLRFSDLEDIEAALKEDEDQRAVRTLDWIGDRINQRSARWVHDLEKSDADTSRSPWWEELRRCAESDHLPSRIEGWNHPVAIILAVSTTTVNPLQAIAALHARNLDFPPWVDSTCFKFTLIVHPHNSLLSDEEVAALFNGVKKQYGLDTYLLSVDLPSPPPPAVAVPALIPRLPPIQSSDGMIPPSVSRTPANSLRLTQEDIKKTAQFARQFVVMSLIPWMERCVVDWNEVFAANRRLLPSRLFSSTRRLFGTSSSATSSNTPPPIQTPQRSQTMSTGQNSIQTSFGGPSQQRRLAEFATILGDLKLAVTIWEALRKEGKGGSEMLPLLLAPSPALALYAQNALPVINSANPELSASAQLQALVYAVRWELGIAREDFSGNILEGERWLVWAAGNAEEPPSALLLAHAALLSARKSAGNRAALWYLTSANRLEKCGIKPLTMYFLRKAQALYQQKAEKAISPLYWDAAGISASEDPAFDAIMPGIEHPLGRLLYTTGDVAGGIRLFLGLLRGSSHRGLIFSRSRADGDMSGGMRPLGMDKIFLEDFRVAFEHFKTIVEDKSTLLDFKLPFGFCIIHKTKVRLPGDSVAGDTIEWTQKEEEWRKRFTSRGAQTLPKGRKASVGETFWIDLLIQNPLDSEVSLSNLSVAVKSSDSSPLNDVDVETIAEITLAASETRIIPISIKVANPALLVITHLTYDFLSLLPAREPLTSRGRRLQDTAQQRQNVVYAPDTTLQIEVIDAAQKLSVQFSDSNELSLRQGERKVVKIWITNSGSETIHTVWMIAGALDEIYINQKDVDKPDVSTNLESANSYTSENQISAHGPYSIPLSEPLEPGSNLEFEFTLHADCVGPQQLLALLFVYHGGKAIRSTRVSRYYSVTPIMETEVTVSPGHTSDHLYQLDLTVTNVSTASDLHLTQVTLISPQWSISALNTAEDMSLAPMQMISLRLGASRLSKIDLSFADLNSFVRKQLSAVLHGRRVEMLVPPPINLSCSHIAPNPNSHSALDSAIRHFIRYGRRNVVSRTTAAYHPHIPPTSLPHIFPLYNPYVVDAVVFWEIPNEQRSGHLLLTGITVGAGHAQLDELIFEAENIKAKRDMYAETQREKVEILDSIRRCEWNSEVNPITVTVGDGLLLEHNFNSGGFQSSISFILRNMSATNRSKYTLNLKSEGMTESFDLQPPQFRGHTTFRGILEPSETVTLSPKLWISRPGTYSLGNWRLDTEVGEAGESWRTRQRYTREPPPDDQSCITIADVQ